MCFFVCGEIMKNQVGPKKVNILWSLKNFLGLAITQDSNNRCTLSDKMLVWWGCATYVNGVMGSQPTQRPN